MGRDKPSSQQVTFAKHRSGLFKKAHELAVLCDAEIAIVIASSTGKMHSFASPNSNMKMIQERYYRRKSMKEKRNEVHVDLYSESNNIDVDCTSKDSLNIEDLDRGALCDLEQKLSRKMSLVQRFKDQRMMEHLEELHMKKCYLGDNNEILNKMVWLGKGTIGSHPCQQSPCLVPTNLGCSCTRMWLHKNTLMRKSYILSNQA